LGFLGIVSPVLRRTLGQVTTIPQGCKRQGKDLDEVIKKLIQEGFKVKK
jgi:hypothetical protein